MIGGPLLIKNPVHWIAFQLFVNPGHPFTSVIQANVPGPGPCARSEMKVDTGRPRQATAREISQDKPNIRRHIEFNADFLVIFN